MFGKGLFQEFFKEILIIILGVSIAFALNSWASNQQDRAVEEIYLTGLLQNLQLDKQQLSDNQAAIQLKLLRIEQLVPHLGKALPRRDTVVGHLFQLANVSRFFANSTSYQTMVNSGDLKLVKEIELRYEISGLYEFYNYLLQEYERHYEFNKRYFGDYFVQEIDYQSIRQGDFSFLDDPLILNIVNSLRGILTLKQTANEEALQKLDALIGNLESYLDTPI